MKSLTTAVSKKRFNCFHFLSLAIGIVYVWFGLLKFFPEASPAETIAKNTVYLLTFKTIPVKISYFILAVWESGLGLLFIANCCIRFSIRLALIHMVCTFLPFLLFPDETFTQHIWTFTLLGQYIMKNLIIIGALWVLYEYHRSRPLSTTE